jgi:replication factor C subunit 3/5
VVEKEGLTTRLQSSGETAILRQANGDMRKVLNVLQACSNGYDTIDEDAVYSSIGNAKPSEVRALFETLLKKTFKEGYDGEFLWANSQYILSNQGSCFHSFPLLDVAALTAFFTEGYALSDVLTELAGFVEKVKLPKDVKCLLLDKLSDVEYRLAFGTSEKLQAASLVAAFEMARAKASEVKTAAAGPGAAGPR